MSRVLRLAAAFVWATLASTAAWAQVNFQKTGYYAALGDSVGAGEGAVPVTNGYAYVLYERGVFGQKQEIDFANLAVRGGRSWDLLDHQVPQLLCAEPAQRPTVVTITAGANDFLRGDPDVPAIAARVVDAVNTLLYNGTPRVGAERTVRDPRTNLPCRPLTGVTIMVSNYYSIPHPDPVVFAQLDGALRGFAYLLQVMLAPFIAQPPDGSRVALVDLFTPSLDRQGLLLIQRRLGYEGPLDFEIHPTNLGHSFIAQQFENVWGGQ